jgi:hypothetical protein
MKAYSRICLALILLSAHVALTRAQGNIPPLGEDAFLSEGSIVNKYDQATDQSKIEFMTMLEGHRLNGIGLYGVFIYQGKVLTKPAQAFLGIISISKDGRFEKTDKLVFLIDGKRQTYDQLYNSASEQTPVGLIQIELALLSALFERNGILEFANAQVVEGKIGQYQEFRFSQTQFRLLREFADLMQPPGRTLNSIASDSPERGSRSGSSTNSGSASGGGRKYIRGPRDGCYYISGSGKKVYVDRSWCN